MPSRFIELTGDYGNEEFTINVGAIVLVVAKPGDRALVMYAGPFSGEPAATLVKESYGDVQRLIERATGGKVTR